MEGNEVGDLRSRVDRLEHEVRELRGLLSRPDAVTRESPDVAEEPVSRDMAPRWDTSAYTETRGSGDGGRFEGWLDRDRLGDLGSWEWWLNKVGIGLLLFGVAFLFMYSVERGWLTPALRVAFGGMVGVGLLALGLRVSGRRPAFSQVLLGGSVAAFYISCFAAFQLYSLVPYPVAFGAMVLITVLAFYLALRHGGVSLSVIGAAGGLATPFLLYNGAGSVAAFVAYTCVVLAGAGAVYFSRGWNLLAIISFLGGWLTLLVGYLQSYSLPNGTDGERLPVQLGVAFVWLLFSALPALRGVLGRDDSRELTGWTKTGFVFSSPLIALAFTAMVWSLSSREAGWISLSAFGLYLLVGLGLRYLERGLSRDLAYVHILTAAVLLALATALILRDDALLLALAVEAVALHLAARRFSDLIVAAQAHVLYAIVAGWLAFRLAFGIEDGASFIAAPGEFATPALLDLAVLASGIAVSFALRGRTVRAVYRAFAYVGLLAWLWRELAPLAGGDAYVSVAWGTCAVALLVAGLRWDLKWLVRAGMATLFVVVGKLFLVDLAEIEAIWRVLLFTGFGVAFLALSYYLRGLWRPTGGGSQSPEGPGSRSSS